jgi:S1-C subfamily serine protease
MMRMKNVRVWIVAVVGMTVGLSSSGSVAWAAENDAGPWQEILRNTARSFVMVNYHLKKSDHPYMNGSEGPEYGQQGVLQRIINKNTADVIGVILNDAGEVLTFDREPIYREVVDRITIRGPDGKVVPARASRLLVRAPGRIVQIESDLPEGWQPLQFAEQGEVTGDTKLYVATVRPDQYYHMYIKACEYGCAWTGIEACSPCLQVPSPYGAGVLCNAEGEPVGATCMTEIDLGPDGPAWRGRDILADAGVSDEQQEELEDTIRRQFARNLYEIRIMPRPDPREEEFDGGPYRYRGGWPGQESTRERLFYGLAFADDKLLIPEALPRDFVAGIDTIVVRVDGQDVPARFGGVLKAYAATVIELEQGRLPQTLAFPADGTLARIKPFWAVTARELAGMDVRITFGRWIEKQQGYEDKWYPTLERPVPSGSWLLDRGGRLVGFLTRARYEHDRLEPYLLGRGPDRYRSYGPGYALLTSGTPSGPGYAGDSRLLDASVMATVLGDVSTNCDPRVRHLDKDEQKRRVWLGVEYTSPEKEMIKQMGLREPTQDGRIGLVVNRVYAGSPAAAMGLTEGDVLLKIAVPGMPWLIELQADRREEAGMPDYGEEDIPQEFRAMGYRMPRRRPWPSRDNYLTGLLDDIGRGTTVRLSYIHGTDLLEKEFTIQQAPRDMLSAAKYKNDRLGLTVKDVTYEIQTALRLDPNTSAVVVTKIEQGTPAALARINPYELIRAVDGEQVAGVEVFEKLIAAAQQQDKESVRLTIEWMGKTRLADLKFEAAAPPGLLNSLLRGPQ